MCLSNLTKKRKKKDALLTSYGKKIFFTIMATYLEKLTQGDLCPFYYIFMYKYRLDTQQITCR